MNKKRKTFNGVQIVSAICMILALLWLTVSLPFVYASQQAGQEMSAQVDFPVSDCEDESNPLSGSTEEKAPSTSVSEEYLHDHHKSESFFLIASQFHKCENADTYIAFHGELLVPPPNQAS